MIEASDVGVHFRKRRFAQPIRALDGFSVRIERGDVFGLLGPNGAGKSTAMYCFLGLIRPDRGRVTVMGAAPEPGAAAFEKVAYVPEEPHYHLYLTVEEAASFYASLYAAPVPKAQVHEALRRVGLWEHRDLRLDRCSKGMKQKLGIAVCLLSTPSLVFLDEPTRGLDPVIVKEFRDILLEMSRAGATVVINSHVLSEVELVCNRVAIMDRGKVVACDELRRLMTVDREHYRVTMEPVDPPPPFMTLAAGTPGEIHGIIPTALVRDLFEYAAARNVRVFECALKRTTLEDAFFSILQGRG